MITTADKLVWHHSSDGISQIDYLTAPNGRIVGRVASNLQGAFRAFAFGDEIGLFLTREAAQAAVVVCMGYGEIAC